MRPEQRLAGRYLLERRAGTGGMGEVWKAFDQDGGTPVAVKILSGYNLEDAARFAREARILSGLEHPGIVQYLSHGEGDEGAPYLVMEWLEGEDLAARLARGRLAIDESVALARDVAEVLAFAHARGVVHRDLKPSNLFLLGGRLDAVRVLDFGIAHAALSSRITHSGVLLGTPGYMAPEQARGETHIDARADIFSLGCVLFECLTGAPPFRGEHAAAVLTRVLFDATPRARSLRPELPEPLDTLVARMLSRNREERPCDGRAAAAALRALGDLPESAPVSLRTAIDRAGVLTDGEQRAAAIILVGVPAPAATPPQGDAPTVELETDADLLREAARYGGAGERLIDGSVAVLMSGSSLATDLCAQAARCALALRAHAPGRPIVLTIGRRRHSGKSVSSAIDRAARLAAGAVPEGAVALDEIAAGLLDARFNVREADGAFTLHGERPLAESTRLLLGKATPCVGRERELATIRDLLAECAEDRRAQAAIVLAPPGVGKSRLAQELLRELRAQGEGISVWVARGDALRAGSPFHMLGQALRSACGIREAEPAPVRRERLLTRIAALIDPPEQRRVAHFLGELMDLPFPDDDDLPLRAARRDAQLMTDQVRAAALDFLAAACAEGPVLVLLEDLHWGDRSTLQLLDRALRDLTDRPLFLLALARPELREVSPRLWQDRRLHELRLNELSRRACERLARHVLGPDADPEAIARIVQLSEGNAFYLEELLRWTAAGRGASVPETVVAMVESRLGSLDDDARRILRAASVFGEAFWPGGVAALVGGEAHRDGVLAALSALVEREVLVRRRASRFPDEEQLAFRHALLREGAYNMLTEEDRALGHQLAGEWLEARGEADAIVLAAHFEQGRDALRAGRYYLSATQRAAWSGDGSEALKLARRGLSLPLPEPLRLSLLGALCEASAWYYEVAPAIRLEAEELSRSAPRGSAPWLQGMLVRLMNACWESQIAPMLGCIDEMAGVEAIPEAADAFTLALGTAANALYGQGRVRESALLLSRIEALSRAGGGESPFSEIEFRTVRSWQAGAGDDLLSALADARRSEELSRRCGSRRYENLARICQAMNLFYLGATGEAERAFAAMTLSEAEFWPGLPYRPFIQAWMLADRGALAEARREAEGNLATALATGLPILEGIGRWILAEVLRRAGELDAAEREAEAALPGLRLMLPIDEPGALATLAATRLAQGRPADALAAAELGVARVAACGTCGFFYRGAFLRLVHAEALEACGRRGDALAALAEARDRLLAIAARIQEPGYRSSFLEEVPENRRTLALAEAWLGSSSGAPPASA